MKKLLLMIGLQCTSFYDSWIACSEPPNMLRFVINRYVRDELCIQCIECIADLSVKH